MKAQRTFVFAILVLTTLAVGSLPAQAAPAGTEACARQAQALVTPVEPLSPAAAPAPLPAPVETPFASVQPEKAAAAGQDCLRFCMVAFCPGTKCGALPGGGCGCL